MEVTSQALLKYVEESSGVGLVKLMANNIRKKYKDCPNKYLSLKPGQKQGNSPYSVT